MRSATSAPPSWSKPMASPPARASSSPPARKKPPRPPPPCCKGSLGEAGRHVLFEEFLEGEEISFLVISDGERVAPLVAAQDHKRIGDGDTGPNTGGMGAYSTSGLIDDNMRDWLLRHIARPVIDGMAEEGAPYTGILYCGLMMTAKGPQVLEFNCRFGDPETQPILMRLDSDLLEAFEASIEGRVSDGIFRWSPDPSVCVVIAAGGYPGPSESGKPSPDSSAPTPSMASRSSTPAPASPTARSRPRADASSESPRAPPPWSLPSPAPTRPSNASALTGCSTAATSPIAV